VCSNTSEHSQGSLLLGATAASLTPQETSPGKSTQPDDTWLSVVNRKSVDFLSRLFFEKIDYWVMGIK